MSAQMNDHQEAVKNLMAERYLLGELDAGEREAYEEHLFSCDACFEQVKAGTEFVSHLRMGVEEPVAVVAQSRWPQFLRSMLRPAPVFGLAACMLAGASLYQNMITIQMLKAPQPESRYMVTEASRGNAVIKAQRNSRIRLAVEFGHTKEFVSYEAQIQTADSNVKYTVSSLQPSQDTIEFSIYAGALQPGKYVLVVYGRDGDSKQELARNPFTMQFTD